MEKKMDEFEKKVKKVEQNVERLERFSMIRKLEGENIMILLELIQELRKDVDELKEKI